LNDDFHGFFLAAVVELGLLGAIADGVLAGELGEESEGSKEGDRGDVGASFGGGKALRVLVKETREGFIVALAEEIGLANSGVGKRRIEGERGRREKRRCQECCDRAGRGMRHGVSLVLDDNFNRQVSDAADNIGQGETEIDAGEVAAC